MAVGSEELQHEAVVAYQVAAKLGQPLLVWTVVHTVDSCSSTRVFFAEEDAREYAEKCVTLHSPDNELRLEENLSFLKNHGVIEFDDGRTFIHIEPNQVI